jgi:hypothetical protein
LGRPEVYSRSISSEGLDSESIRELSIVAGFEFDVSSGVTELADTLDSTVMLGKYSAVAGWLPSSTHLILLLAS